MSKKDKLIDDSFSELGKQIKESMEQADIGYMTTTQPRVEDIKTLDQATEFIRRQDKAISLSWFYMAHGLKKVRDEKLYSEKYPSFDEYWKNELDYKRRMVYYYLEFAEAYPLNTCEKVLQAGITKLLAVSDLLGDQKDDYIESHDLTGMTTKEIIDEIGSILNGEEETQQKDTIIEGNGIIIETSATQENNEQNNEQNNDHEDDLNVSLSTEELKNIRKLYKKLDTFYTFMEKFKEEQEGNNPVRKERIVTLRTVYNEIKSELQRLEKLFEKYAGE